MADAMNFGPEWLRNLSSEGTTSGAPKYQRAEYRYGREEMLALFDRTTKPPERLMRLQGLFVEKAQTPVALINMTEEENRLWNRGINSDAVLRVNGKVPTGPPGMMRGRGTSVDRGRGRGRGTAGFFTRGNFDEGELTNKEGGPMERPYLRTSRSFDRSQMSERGWPERNGAEPAEWNGSTSPRKEFGGFMRGGLENWRRGRDIREEDDGWRPREKWSTRPTSWREEGAEGNGGRSSNWGRGWAEEGHHGRRGTLDEVPEWATVDSHEPSGSFDASGAFHGYSSDEVEGQNEGSSRRAENLKTNSDQRRGTTDKSGNEPVRRSNSDGEPPSGGGLARSKTAAELGPTSPQPPPQTISKSASTAALSESQVLDRIRTQHQHFITKTEAESPVKPTSEHQPVTRASPVVTNSSPVKEQPEPPVQQTPAAERERERETGVQEVARQGSEDDMARLSMTVDAVVRLIEEEEGKSLQPPPTSADVWFYRDPQGNEQGPFPTWEMFNWYRNGYFLPNLLVRREREERYHSLGDLMRLNDGRVPFLPTNSAAQPAAEAFPFHSMGPQVQAQQQHRVKLTKSDLWSSLTQSQREAMIPQHFRMNQPPAASQVLNSTFTHFLHQYQANLASQAPPDVPIADPVRAMMLMGPPAAHHLPLPGMSHITPPSVPHPLRNSVLVGAGGADLKKDDPVQNALSKLQSANTAASLQTEQPQPQSQRSPVDSLWSGPGRPMTWTNGLAGQPTTPLWNVTTETEILAAESQKILQQRAEEEKQKEEKRKLEELRKKEEEERKEREAAEERRRLEEEEKTRLEQEEKLRREKEEKQKQEEMKKMVEEKKKELKRLEEAKRKEKEKQRRKQAEEEKRRQEQERLRLEKEAEEERKRQEEIAQQQDLQRRQEEALRCLKQQQLKSRMKPWSQSPHTSASLAEIQAQEKEKKLIQQREQSVQEMLAAAAAAEQQAREYEVHTRSNGFNLTWVDQPPPRRENVKSLAEIQAEEQKEMAKILEKERQERAQQQRDLPVTAGVWGGSSLSWSNQGSSPWGSVPAPPVSQGFWDDATLPGKTKVKAPQSPTKSKTQTAASAAAAVASNAAKKQAKTIAKPNKLMARKDEATVMRLFETRENEFTTWCTATLKSMQAGIDVPTFTAFLRDVESPFEVKDYVKTYLGESREAAEFANEFLERRSKWKSAQKTSVEEDDMCAPAAAINPTSVLTDSQDNGKKGKKAKKGRMMKVDARILGFSVTAAQNRINVGQRETWDPNS